MDEHAVERWRREFLDLVLEGGDEPPLMSSMLALARLLQRGETWRGVEATLRTLEEAVVERCAAPSERGHEDAAAELMSLLADHGFTGNTEQYEDVANSLMDRVLERRRGLPITLSILALHLADNAGIELAGVAFPGHFVVGTGLSSRSPVIFDPFNGGRRLDFSDLAALYRAATGKPMTSQAPLLRECLQPASPRAILSRVLRNLQSHYTLRGSHDRAAEVVGLLSVLHPELVQLRDLHGRLHRRLEELN